LKRRRRKYDCRGNSRKRSCRGIIRINNSGIIIISINSSSKEEVTLVAEGTTGVIVEIQK
jgi:hypothetical protein